MNGAIRSHMTREEAKLEIYSRSKQHSTYNNHSSSDPRELLSISHILGARRSHSEEAAHFPLLDAIPHLIHALEVLWHLAGARAAARRLELQQFVGGLAAVLKVEEG